MNIVYVAPFSTPAFRDRCGERNPPGLGGFRKVSLMLDVLTRLGHDVVLLSSVMTSNSELAWRREVHEELTINGRRVEVIYPSALMLRPIGGFLSCLGAGGLARSLSHWFKPDVAIVYNSYLFESRAAKKLALTGRIPVILEVEDLPLARRREWANIKPRIDRWTWDGMLRLAAAFTAVNEPILNQLPMGKPRYLLPGIVDERLVTRGQTRLTPFQTFPRTLGYFGGLTQQKGVRVLCDLIPRMPAGWRLLVTGSGPLAPRLVSLSERYPERLTFLGSVSESDLYEAMCQTDCALVPLEGIDGSGEGVFPFKVMEYLVAGTHVIAPRLPKVGDLDLGFLERWDGTVDSLIVELSGAEQAYREEQSRREEAVAAILNRFSVDAVAESFSKLLIEAGVHDGPKPVIESPP